MKYLTPLKYPRTPHWPTSPSFDEGAFLFANPESLLHRELVITEKLDGSCTCLCSNEVYGRSVRAPVRGGWWTMVKRHHQFKSGRWQYGPTPNIALYGEDIYGVHAIEYDPVDEDKTFYAFGILDLETGQWWPFNLFKDFCEEEGIPVVPVAFRGIFNSVDVLNALLAGEMSLPSALGPEKEGLVIRVADGFTYSDFANNTAKLVRANHVQMSEHWSKYWKPCKLNGRYYASQSNPG